MESLLLIFVFMCFHQKSSYEGLFFKILFWASITLDTYCLFRFTILWFCCNLTLPLMCFYIYIQKRPQNAKCGQPVKLNTFRSRIKRQQSSLLHVWHTGSNSGDQASIIQQGRSSVSGKVQDIYKKKENRPILEMPEN